MRRWFRRKGKDRDLEEGLEEALPVEETEPESQEAPELPEAAPLEVALPEPEASEGSPTAKEEVEPEAAPERRGFFRRWRREKKEEVPSPEEAVVPIDLTLEIPTEPPSSLEAPLLPVSPATPEAVPEASQEPPAAEEASEIPEAEDLEFPGEVPEVVRRKRFQRLRERLQRTREAFSGKLDRLFRGRKVVDAELLEELEELLITADLGVETSLFLIQALQDKLKRRELSDVDRLKIALKEEMVALLTGSAPPEISAHPWVVLMVGVNGVGKTTTIAKLAHRDRHLGLTPMLVAGDTFRAAAVEQLEIWGERVGAAVVKQKTGADPAAVVFDGLAAAQAREVDTVYVDTAGRLHTKVNLMEELKKIHRTAAKKIPGAPHEVLLVLDGTTGQNALNQARLFHEAVGVTGLILTKMDGTAKGGVALAVVHETGIPLRYIGVGEAMADLRPFDAEAFVEAILG
ncbi:MAG: signal recognition particle-docking protein FtsY [Thermodesulfobacteriota bacterium]